MPSEISRSNRPALRRAGSSESGLLVAPITSTWESAELWFRSGKREGRGRGRGKGRGRARGGGREGRGGEGRGGEGGGREGRGREREREREIALKMK